MLFLYALAGLYSILAIIGLLGNLWVMIKVLGQLFVCMNPRTRTEGGRRRFILPGVQSSACIYLLTLSIVDLISFIPVPFLAMDIIQNHWPYNIVLCKLIYTCEGANKLLSPWILTALSIDRYIAVCRPTFVWMRQSRFAFVVIIVCFLFSSLFIVPITIQSYIGAIPDQTGFVHLKCLLQLPPIYEILYIIFCYLIPLTLICFVYISILRRLYLHTRRTTVGRRTSISLGRVVKCSVLVVVFYFICWTPFWLMQIYSILGNRNESQNFMFVMYVLHSLPYTQSAFNWLFYAFLNRNLRNSSRCTLGTRSAYTSTPADNGNINSVVMVAPLWKNIQNMGVYLLTASADTNSTILKKSPFHSRSRIRSRSANCLDSSTTCSKRTFSLSGPLLNTTVGQLTLFNSMVNVESRGSFGNMPIENRPLSAPGVCSLVDLKLETKNDIKLEVPSLCEKKSSLPTSSQNITEHTSPNLSDPSLHIEWL